MFIDAVILFLKRTPRKTLDPVGSGTLVFYEGRLYIVSAAHVFDQLGRGAIYMWAADKLLHLGKFETLLSDLEPYGGLRANDPIDLGVIPVPRDVLSHINGKVKFIQREFVEDEAASKSILLYQAIGFPRSKNARSAERAAAKKSPFNPEVLLVSGEDVTAQLVPPKYDPSIHIAIRFRQKGNYDDDLKRVDAPVPYGMSGGLIQGCFDYIPHSNGLYPTCASAILIEHIEKRAELVGVRFGFVFAWLDRYAGRVTRLKTVY